VFIVSLSVSASDILIHSYVHITDQHTRSH